MQRKKLGRKPSGRIWVSLQGGRIRLRFLLDPIQIWIWSILITDPVGVFRTFISLFSRSDPWIELIGISDSGPRAQNGADSDPKYWSQACAQWIPWNVREADSQLAEVGHADNLGVGMELLTRILEAEFNILCLSLLGLHRISGLFWYPVSGRISGLH